MGHEKLHLHFPSVLLIFGAKLLYTLPPLFSFAFIEGEKKYKFICQQDIILGLC